MKMEAKLSKVHEMQQSILKGRFIVIQAFLKKQRKSQKNLPSKGIRKKKKKPRVKRRKEIIQIRER